MLAVGVAYVGAEVLADAAVGLDAVGGVGVVQEGDFRNVGVEGALLIKKEGQGVAVLAKGEVDGREDHGERSRKSHRQEDEQEDQKGVKRRAVRRGVTTSPFL